MADWIDISRWDRCAELARPGIVFELSNADGLSLFAPCSADVPPAPFDWRVPPDRFREVTEATPEHSSPLPSVSGGS